MANAVLSAIPFPIKYGVARLGAAHELPYKLLGPGDAAVQVGAPHDTLRAGRSRAVHLALRVGPTGHVVVVEPDPTSATALRRIAAERGLRQLRVVECGAWSHEDELQFYIDPSHPATNFTAETAEYSDDELVRFDVERIKVDSIDSILGRLSVPMIKLVSITTNGAERQILDGMQSTIEDGLRYVALARTDPGLEEAMTELDYVRLGYDNRGYTFERRT